MICVADTMPVGSSVRLITVIVKTSKQDPVKPFVSRPVWLWITVTGTRPKNHASRLREGVLGVLPVPGLDQRTMLPLALGPFVQRTRRVRSFAAPLAHEQFGRRRPPSQDANRRSSGSDRLGDDAGRTAVRR
ncbi:hypothetical protein BRD12_07915 [Halobacteriales archaeon SW_12_67_38]|nr:MAG: hypothetical protein BRD12_07915 [Halobacteriales archaeon SW_12_67_38]